jgi:hypothetical protein
MVQSPSFQDAFGYRPSGPSYRVSTASGSMDTVSPSLEREGNPPGLQGNAVRSADRKALKNLLRYRIAAVLCCHGGYFDKDPGPRIQQLAESAPTAA